MGDFCYTENMPNIIVKSNHPAYEARRNALPKTDRFNGAYYYSKDIEHIICPLLTTDRPINVLGIKECGGEDHMIVFVHHYVNVAKRYAWLAQYKDLIIVSSDSQADKVLRHFGKVIHLPLSVNTEEIKKHCVEKKTEDACFYGNPWGFRRQEIEELVPPEVHRFGSMPREKAWDIIAKYKYCYAIGLAAIEASVLRCRLRMSRYRYPNPAQAFPILDCKQAAGMLQRALEILER